MGELYPLRKMLPTILALSLVGHVLVADHHGDGHDDKCVDISRYGDLQYNVSTKNVCTYKIDRICSKKSNQVCVSVPKEDCTVVGFVDCNNRAEVSTQRCDMTGEEHFVAQDCKQDGVEVLEEVKKMPVCTTVTKQQCDSKWVINNQGEKVWDGNENCKDVSWEDCTLEERVITEEVPTYTCNNGETLTYSSHIVKEEDVTSYRKTCQPRGNPVCTQSNEIECTTVEWDDCRDEIIETCKPFIVNVPYQTFHHTLRCSIEHDLETPSDDEFDEIYDDRFHKFTQN